MRGRIFRLGFENVIIAEPGFVVPSVGDILDSMMELTGEPRIWVSWGITDQGGLSNEPDGWLLRRAIETYNLQIQPLASAISIAFDSYEEFALGQDWSVVTLEEMANPGEDDLGFRFKGKRLHCPWIEKRSHFPLAKQRVSWGSLGEMVDDFLAGRIMNKDTIFPEPVRIAGANQINGTIFIATAESQTDFGATGSGEYCHASFERVVSPDFFG